MSETGTALPQGSLASGSPAEADAAFNEGLRRARAGDYAGALHSLARAEACEAGRADTSRLLGKVWIRLGDLDRAAACFRRAVRTDPTDAASRNCLEILRGFRFRRRALAAAAILAACTLICMAFWLSWNRIVRLEAAVVEIENRATPPASLTDGSARSAGNAPISPVPAREAPQAPAKVNSDDVSGETGKMPPYLSDKFGQESAEERSSTGSLPAGALPAALFGERYRAAVNLALAGDLRGAIPKLEELAAADYAALPLAANVHFWLGRCLFGLGETRRALEHFQTVTEKYAAGPKTGEALLDSGRCYLRLGENDKAMESWKAVIDGPFDRGLALIAEGFISRAPAKK